MTKAAMCFGKRLQDFLDNAETREYIRELERLTHAKERELKQARRGRYGGTWGHPKLAVFFARWQEPEARKPIKSCS